MKILMIAALLWLLPVMSLAQPLKPYTLADTYVKPLSSKYNNKGYNLYIRLPRNYSAANSYPLVLVNDADYAFPLTTSIFKRMGGQELRDAIVVGISYSKGDNPQISRTRDYTPTHSPDETYGHSAEAKRHSGQAANYGKFIQQALNEVMQSHSVDKEYIVFVGHSFGGLLGSYLLLTQPKLFDYYLLGSPSLWYDDKYIFKLEAQYARQHKSLPARVFIATGEREQNNQTQMVSNMSALAQQLRMRQYQDLSITTQILKDETHLSSFPSMLSNGLRWALPLK